jgi:cell division protein FtsQ
VTDPRIHERRVRVAREIGRRRRRLVSFALLVVTVAAAGLAVVHSSVFGARHVEVTGLQHESSSAVIEAAGLKSAPPLVDLSTAVIARRVEALPWVHQAKVAFSFPSTVHIAVTERVPVAVTGEGGRFDLLDDTGRVLEQLTGRPSGFPLIASSPPLLGPGQAMGQKTAQLTAVAAAMPESMVSEIDELSWSTGGIVARLNDGLVAQLGGPTEASAKFVALATVLAHGNLSGIGTVNLEVPTAPVLIRRASSPIVAGNVSG